MPQGHGGGDGRGSGPVAAAAGDRGGGGHGRADQAGDVAAGGGAGCGSGRARLGRAAAGGAAGCRADRSRVGGRDSACVRGLRANRQAVVPRHWRRRVPAVPELAASRRMRQLRQGQARLRPGRGRPARLRGVPPPRPGAPPGLPAMRQDCAGLPVTSACADCGTEDKMFEKHRCARCSLRRRAAILLSAGTGDIPDTLAAVLEAISAARTPKSALNWLRTGAGSAILADLAAGRLAVTHEALDQHPRPKAASHLRHMLIAGGALPPRDEELTRTEQWLAALLASIDAPGHRRLVHAFATWHVMRRLRRAAAASRRPRTYTAHARNTIKAAAGFLTWLSGRGITLPGCRQPDVEDWLATGPGA